MIHQIEEDIRYLQLIRRAVVDNTVTRGSYFLGVNDVFESNGKYFKANPNLLTVEEWEYLTMKSHITTEEFRDYTTVITNAIFEEEKDRQN
ncbi:MAG: hypothetical protein V1870_04840 [Candidatus Aenigmatarchaeota archaeon]